MVVGDLNNVKGILVGSFDVNNIQIPLYGPSCFCIYCIQILQLFVVLFPVAVSLISYFIIINEVLNERLDPISQFLYLWRFLLLTLTV